MPSWFFLTYRRNVKTIMNLLNILTIGYNNITIYSLHRNSAVDVLHIELCTRKSWKQEKKMVFNEDEHFCKTISIIYWYALGAKRIQKITLWNSTLLFEREKLWFILISGWLNLTGKSTRRLIYIVNIKKKTNKKGNLQWILCPTSAARPTMITSLIFWV